jgi:hypothetical protein
MSNPFDAPAPTPETPPATSTPEASKPEEQRPQAPDELTLLKQRAQIMGIQVPPNIKVETLKLRIQEKVDSDRKADVERAKAKSEAQVDAALQKQFQAQSLPEEFPGKAPKVKTKQELARDLKQEYLKLVRVKVVCLDPSKAELKGEIVTVANGILGKVSKFIPYGDECGEDGYHIPYILYLFLKEKRFYQVKKDKRGTPIKSVEMPEYAIEKLPQLTAEQLKSLAQRQKAAQGTTESSSGETPVEA